MARPGIASAATEMAVATVMDLSVLYMKEKRARNKKRAMSDRDCRPIACSGARNEKAALGAAFSGAGDAYAAGLLVRRAAAAVAAFVATAAAALKFVSAISTACFVAF